MFVTSINVNSEEQGLPWASLPPPQATMPVGVHVANTARSPGVPGPRVRKADTCGHADGVPHPMVSPDSEDYSQTEPTTGPRDSSHPVPQRDVRGTKQP